LTRSGVCLLRGDLLGSLRYHAFGPLLTGIGLTGLAGSLLPTLQRRRLIEMLNRFDHRLHLTPAIFIGLIIYTLTRWIFDL